VDPASQLVVLNQLFGTLPLCITDDYYLAPQKKFKEKKTQWLFEKINSLSTLVQTHWFLS
jgi:hypothetical protein